MTKIVKLVKIMQKSLVSQKRKQRPLRILDAASKLMQHYGFDKTTMEDIACEAGVSKGALYLEWSSREALFEALFENEMRKLLLDLRALIECAQDGSFANLYALTLVAMRRSPLICALYTRDGRILGDFVHHQDPERYVRRLLLSNESVKNLQAQGLLRRDLAPDVITHLFMVIAMGLLSISSVIPAEKSPDLDATIHGIALMVQDGLALSNSKDGDLKQATLQLMDLMLSQYEEKNHEN